MAESPSHAGADALTSARQELLKAAELIRNLKAEKERNTEQLRALQRAVRLSAHFVGSEAQKVFFYFLNVDRAPRRRSASSNVWCVRAGFNSRLPKRPESRSNLSFNTINLYAPTRVCGPRAAGERGARGPG